ncbi:MAG: IS3 family transposase [Gammaproteobacteria bacterium]|nr:IS3 family transposase [Gammaproteobacteria bacterium]
MPVRPDCEVSDKAQRRRFTVEYKLKILEQADACVEPGQIGALLRREGLYSSHLSKWRKQREKAVREGLSESRGRKPAEKNPLAEQVAGLQQENRRLQQRLTRAEAIIDVQKKPLATVGVEPDKRELRGVIMQSAVELSSQVGVLPACEALHVNRAQFYREQAGKQENEPEIAPRPRPPLALTEEETQQVLEVLHSERFIDHSPYEVYAALLDEGCYLCSIPTMYRILERNQEVRERRNQLSRPRYARPELLAVRPCEVWSWDITKLKGPARWTYFHLYVIIDIYSRYVVGWMVATRESATLAERLISETCQRQNIERGQLTVHADRGSSMKSKCVEHLLADLGVTKTHSRPHVSNDNPYSEAWFKTLKYRPGFPARFGSVEDARAFCRVFFEWYNYEHYHSGIALMTPYAVHSGQADKILAKRNQVLLAAFEKKSNRFKGRLPQAQAVPEAAWINPPEKQAKVELKPETENDTGDLH